MKDNYSKEEWTGQVFNEEDLFWGLDTQIDPLFEVGYGNVLFISGWCFHRAYQIKEAEIILDQIPHKPCHINIIRADISKMFLNDNSLYKNSKYSGFWCIIPIKKLSEQKSTRIVLDVTFDNGHKRSIVLGKTIISPKDFINKNFDYERNKAYEMVSKIKRKYSKPHIVICLASYNPNRDLFQNQIYSIQNQIYQNWSCIISDDCSEMASYEWIREFVGHDERFLIVRNQRNIGFYKNFEKLLYLVPENADFVALSDQDDYWFSDKIGRMVCEFRDDTTLVYSDMNIVDKNGKLISNTFWTTRKNYYNELDYLILVNTITGAASMFRSSIIKYILPFPINIGTSYHDHWIGCVANALGEIEYIDAPLYDYYQHGANILGQAKFSKKCLCDMTKNIKNFLSKDSIKSTLIFYQCVFNVDGIRSIIIALNLRIRISHMEKKKRNKIKKFYNLEKSSYGLLFMVIKTTLSEKTTCNAERYLLKAYWADKTIRSRIAASMISST